MNIPTPYAQGLALPARIKEIYRTTWEIKQRSLIDMAADRGRFICQSQSLNAFMDAPNHDKLTSMHFHAWKKGLKTGMYYLRSKPAAAAIQFTVDRTSLKAPTAGRRGSDGPEDGDDDVCLSCQ